MSILRKDGTKEGRRGGLVFHNGRGFTLIEVMVAIALLVIGILGLIATATSVIQGNAISRQMTTAMSLGSMFRVVRKYGSRLPSAPLMPKLF